MTATRLDPTLDATHAVPAALAVTAGPTGGLAAPPTGGLAAPPTGGLAAPPAGAAPTHGHPRAAARAQLAAALAITALALAGAALGACGSTKPGAGAGPDAKGSGSNGTPDGGGSGTGSVAGCDGATFLANPTDPSAPGPWTVGARTVTIGRLTVEIWYPAAPGSESGKTKAVYDIRDELPTSERSKIPDADNPPHDCDCYRDLPIDDAHGKYPVVVFVHGTAAFRHQSLPIMTHWASRGFVVVAADHPGLDLGDILASACSQPQSGSQDLSGDLDAELAALAAASGDLAFLAGHLDTTRVAVAGHSAGAGAAATASTKPGVKTVLSFAGAQSATAASTLASSLFMGGESDNIASWNHVKQAWTGSPTPRRLVEIGNAGHLVFSDLCQIKNAAGKNILQIAQDKGICGASLAGFLFDCNTSYIDGPTGWKIVDYASSAVLEPLLQCATGLPDVSGIMQAMPDIKDYEQAL